MFLIVGSLLGRFGTIGKCRRSEMLRVVWVRFFWFGSRGGLLGSTPSKNVNEVSARSCLPMLSDLRLFVDVCDFASVLRGIDCFDCRSDNTGTLRTPPCTRRVQSDRVGASL